MKILFHVGAHFIGGAERQMQYLLKYLLEIFEEGEWAPVVTYEKKEVGEIFQALGIPSFHVGSKKDLSKNLERVRPDIVQFYTSPMVHRALTQISFRPKVIEVIHNKNQFNGDSTSYPKDKTDIAVCVSHDAEKFILSHCNKLRTVVIKNGVDSASFWPHYNCRSKTPVIGFTGRLCPDKGIARLIELAPQFHAPLELVGQDFANYRAYQYPNVTIFPRVEHPEHYYSKWWATVSASPHESFGMTIAESLACNTPVAMLDCGGITRYLTHKKHALIARTERELVGYVNQIIAGEVKLDPLGVTFSAKKMAEEYASLYQDLMQVKNIPKPLANKGQAASDTATLFRPISKPIDILGGALGVTPRAWYGVVRSLAGYCSQYAEPSTAVALIKRLRPKFVVLGCYQADWRPICEAAHEVGSLVVATWHASYILNEFHAINRTWMGQMLQDYKMGFIDYLATPHKGLAESWTSYGYETSYFPNIVEDTLTPVKKLPGINIGILGSGQNWKNMECQIVAAGMIKGAQIHVQEVAGLEVIDRLGINVITHPKTLTDTEYYDLLGGMTVNLCVSLSEVYSYLTAESFLMETPVITSSITPILRSGVGSGPSIAETYCGTPYFEDPVAIANQIKIVIAEKDKIGPRLREHMRAVNEENRSVCEEVIRRWK